MLLANAHGTECNPRPDITRALALLTTDLGILVQSGHTTTTQQQQQHERGPCKGQEAVPAQHGAQSHCESKKKELRAIAQLQTKMHAKPLAYDFSCLPGGRGGEDKLGTYLVEHASKSEARVRISPHHTSPHQPIRLRTPTHDKGEKTGGNCNLDWYVRS